ncbi:hypothetical protein DPMN_136553 [Dreissena polymorpha]|uniref:Uncharacterized protein n=1 Tax=Dreissena polymorpha TaxID=45954 RepID=A0A9D4G413_DREPO|nr:hypothetical protein DPMN_136553 [Dreissena polymorpha]
MRLAKFENLLQFLITNLKCCRPASIPTCKTSNAEMGLKPYSASVAQEKSAHLRSLLMSYNECTAARTFSQAFTMKKILTGTTALLERDESSLLEENRHDGTSIS